MYNLKNISPDYPRIPHLDSRVSKMTHDDIVIESKVDYPLQCYVGEKIDGANLGISWYNNVPIVRNKNFVLKKGYSKIKTPAKEQFKSTWNWVHDHKDDIIQICNEVYSDVTIYGEWMMAYHSVKYDKLPSAFIAYDIWSVEDRKFLSPKRVQELLSKTTIPFIKSQLMTFNSLEDIVIESELKSDYSNGYREGIVLKTVEGDFVKDFYKVVNKYFNRREDFNENLIKNKFVKLV